MCTLKNILVTTLYNGKYLNIKQNRGFDVKYNEY